MSRSRVNERIIQAAKEEEVNDKYHERFLLPFFYFSHSLFYIYQPLLAPLIFTLFNHRVGWMSHDTHIHKLIQVSI